MQGTVKQLKVMLKSDWAQKKEEMKAIKREIANLCPDKMFQSNAHNLETTPESKAFEEGSILRLSGLPS